jgi:hypothetical protein
VTGKNCEYISPMLDMWSCQKCCPYKINYIRNNDTPVAISTPITQILVFKQKEIVILMGKQLMVELENIR